MQKGYAVFLPPSASLADLRRETRRALLAGQKAAAYEIICEEYVYPGHFLQTLRAIDICRIPDQRSTGGAFFCLALWDGETGAGLLLRRIGKELQCAYLPAITPERARLEETLISDLGRAAQALGDLPVHLQQGIPAGQYALGDLMRILADMI